MYPFQVYLALIPNDKEEIDHINNCKTDNHINNLKTSHTKGNNKKSLKKSIISINVETNEKKDLY